MDEKDKPVCGNCLMIEACRAEMRECGFSGELPRVTTTAVGCEGYTPGEVYDEQVVDE